MDVKIDWETLQKMCMHKSIDYCVLLKNPCCREDCQKIKKDDKNQTIKISQDTGYKRYVGYYGSKKNDLETEWKVGDSGIITEDFSWENTYFVFKKYDGFVVKEIDGYGVMSLEFENPREIFHNCGRLCKDNCGWWLNKNYYKYLKKISL